MFRALFSRKNRTRVVPIENPTSSADLWQRPSDLADDIYARSMYPVFHKRGHVLRTAEPSTITHSDTGIRTIEEILIGDVCYLSDAGVPVRLFNIIWPEWDPTCSMPPVRSFREEFPAFYTTTLSRLSDPKPDFLTAGYHWASNSTEHEASGSLNGQIPVGPGAEAQIGATVSSKRGEGAVLALAGDACFQSIKRDDHLRRYLVKYGAEIYDFVTGDLGQRLEMDELLFVTGHVKTGAWATWAFKEASSSRSYSCQISAGSLVGASSSLSRSCQTSQSPSHSCGPRAATMILHQDERHLLERSIETALAAEERQGRLATDALRERLQITKRLATPSLSEASQIIGLNQCLLIEGYRMKKRRLRLPGLGERAPVSVEARDKAPSGLVGSKNTMPFTSSSGAPGQTGDTQRSSGTGSALGLTRSVLRTERSVLDIESLSENSVEFRDGLDSLLDYILTENDVDRAIAHPLDLLEVLAEPSDDPAYNVGEMIRTSHKLITTESRVGYLAASPAVPLHDPNTPISRPDEDSLSQQSVYDAFVMVWQSLKTATQLASNIYERVQGIKQDREAFEQLGLQVFMVLIAICDVLEGTQLEPQRLSKMYEQIGRLTGVLKDIQTAVDKCIPSSSQSTRKHNKVVGLIRSQAAERKRTLAAQADVEELRRKLRHVADEFWVPSPLRSEPGAKAIRDRLLQRVSQLEEKRLDLFQVQVSALQRATEDDALQKAADHDILISLEPVMMASWEINTEVVLCAPGTRGSILRDIENWACAINAPAVLWLTGLAGTGKSTIARTLCARLADQGLLGAGFFVTRYTKDCREASNIVRSIAYQLAYHDSSFASALCKELRQRPIHMPRSLEKQIVDFITGPASALVGPSLVIVLDALDECFSDVRGRPGGDLLPRLVHGLRLSGRLRLFVTSRTDNSITHMFRSISAEHQQAIVRLQDVDKDIVRNDILLYLKHSFAGIRSDHPELLFSEWPSIRDLELLANISGTLFILAATMIRFISHPRYSPRVRLNQLIHHDVPISQSPYRTLDLLYMQVLQNAVGDPDNYEEILRERLAALLTVIATSQTPLTVDALTVLSGSTDRDETITVVQSLSAVLLHDEGEPVRIFHPSFTDFIVDSERCNDVRFLVEPDVGHGRLASHCLGLMSRSLCYDICDIRDPAVANREVHDLEKRLFERVPEALNYAASFWGCHLSFSGTPNKQLLNKLEGFCRKHLFHWLEIGSLLRTLPSAEAYLRQVLQWFEKHGISRGDSFSMECLRNALKTLQVYALPIRSHALHVYHSAYPTMPQNILVDTLAEDAWLDQTPHLVSPRAPDWGPLISVLEGHTGGVRSVAPSPDGRCFASGSEDYTVRVWDMETSEVLAELCGHQDLVTCVAFSPDATRLASASDDRTVRVWSTDTFENLATLEGHDDWVTSVVFSPDCRFIASASGDNMVRIWHCDTFLREALLEGHQESITSISFSPDGRWIVSASDDRTVRVWDASTYEQHAELRHEDSVTSVAFSPEGTRIASSSKDGTLRMWSAGTFMELVKVESNHGPMISVTFSPDGTRVATGSVDHIVRVWDAYTLEELSVLTGHQNAVFSVAFSPDGTQIVTGSDDRTIRVWHIDMFENDPRPNGHTGQQPISCLAFSPDRARIVSGSDDGITRVWLASSCKQVVALFGHNRRVSCVAFSPNGLLVASGSDDHKVRIWDVGRSLQLHVFEGHSGPVTSVAFSPDGLAVSSLGRYDDICRWKIDTGSNVTSISASESPFTTAPAHEPKVALKEFGWLVGESSKALLWLPVEQRGPWASSGSRVAIGSYKGDITVLDFPSLETHDDARVPVEAAHAMFRLQRLPDGPIRWLSFQEHPTWPALVAQIAHVFEITESEVAVAYINTVGNVVALTSDEDLQQLYQVAVPSQAMHIVVTSLDVADKATPDLGLIELRQAEVHDEKKKKILPMFEKLLDALGQSKSPRDVHPGPPAYEMLLPAYDKHADPSPTGTTTLVRVPSRSAAVMNAAPAPTNERMEGGE